MNPNDTNDAPRRPYERGQGHAALWIDDGRGQIVDELAVETRELSGEDLPRPLDLEFELAIFELQPVPPRYRIEALQPQITEPRPPIDLVAHRPGPLRFASHRGKAEHR